jgi:hypothetical protein
MMTKEQLADMFAYLDGLRESGATNMFGAGPYVKSAFGLTDRDARDVLSRWMRTFDGESTPEARAEKALAVA